MTQEPPDSTPSPPQAEQGRWRIVSPALLEPPEMWAEQNLMGDSEGRLRVIIELNLMHEKGLDGATLDLGLLF
jgi:hypothetical protein